MTVFLPEKMYQENPFLNGNRLICENSHLSFVNKPCLSFWQKWKVSLGFECPSLKKTAMFFAAKINKKENPSALYSNLAFQEFIKNRTFIDLNYLAQNLRELNFQIEKYNERHTYKKYIGDLSIGALPTISESFISDIFKLSLEKEKIELDKIITVIEPNEPNRVISKFLSVARRINENLLYIFFMWFPFDLYFFFFTMKTHPKTTFAYLGITLTFDLLSSLFLKSRALFLFMCFSSNVIFFFLFFGIKHGVELLKAHFWQDFSLEKKSHLLEKYKNSDIILTLEANLDPNKAFENNFPSNLDSLYPVAYRKISTIGDINKAFDDALLNSNRIKHLIFRCHGTPNYIVMDAEMKEGSFTAKENSILCTKDISKISASLNKVDKDGSIFLYSCSTGKSGVFNIAKQFSRFAPNRRVFAPTEACSTASTFSLDPLKVTFYSVFNKNITAVFKSSVSEKIHLTSYHSPLKECDLAPTLENISANTFSVPLTC
jgi:hypothetical protein